MCQIYAICMNPRLTVNFSNDQQLENTHFDKHFGFSLAYMCTLLT